MAISPKYRYVNGMRNIAWIVGYLRKKGDQYFVQQNNNEEQMVPIVVPQNFILPSERSPIEAACHVFGERKDDEQQCYLKVFEVNRPSIRSMPVLSTWVRGSKKSGDTPAGTIDDEFRPFLSKGEIKKEFLEKIDSDPDQVSESDKLLAEWFRSNRMDSRLGENANKVFLAGFLGATRFVPPNEHQKHGYGEIYLHQYREPERAIPIRLYNNAVHGILKGLQKGRPVAFAGQMRMKILPDDAGNVRHRSLHVRVEDIFVVDSEKDFMGDPPLWWGDLFREGRKELHSRQESPTATKANQAQEDDGVPVIPGL
jgi:hypothetical protein